MMAKHDEWQVSCSDCGWSRTWILFDNRFYCLSEQCFEGRGNKSYFESPAFGQHYGDENGVGLFLSVPPAQFYRDLSERSSEFKLPFWKWLTLAFLTVSAAACFAAALVSKN